MTLFLVCFTSGASILLSFLLFFHPLQQNVKANRWLGLFVFIMGCAFISTYLLITGRSISAGLFFKALTGVQFLLAPSLYMSTLYFVKPGKVFTAADLVHFIPFVVYSIAEIWWMPRQESISTLPLLHINENVSFLVRDILPFLSLFYLIRSYRVLLKHRSNLKLISANLSEVDLGWLVQFLFILLLTIIIWINDALFELPFLTEATPFVYTGCIFFLAYFSIKQRAIFAFREQDMKEILYVLDQSNHESDAIGTEATAELQTHPTFAAADEQGQVTEKEQRVIKRLTAEQLERLSARLISLMETDRLFLDNDLNLPMVAERLGIGIHETSFLINQTTNSNFYNFINKYRVNEAKKLLGSAKMEQLNMLGIAFASGFNSKTTFNTTFKKMVGVSPSEYLKNLKN